MRISDWSSDVCSSDLARYAGSDPQWRYRGARRRVPARIDHRCVEGAVAWRYPAARLPVPQRQQERHQARTPDLRDAEGAAGRFEGELSVGWNLSRHQAPSWRAARVMTTGSSIFLIGPMGAGKTTVGRRLAELRGLPFIDSDHEIEERTGVDIARSDERRVGKEGVSTCRSRWSPENSKK